jgi:starch-binding outer membrane protein, SusD/RagB family
MTNRTLRDLARWSFAVLLFAPLAACNILSDALDVTAPDRIERGPLEQPQNASILLNGAIGDFECALGAFAVAGGLMSGELIESTATASRWSYDRRAIQTNENHYSTFDCQTLGVYTPIQTARWTADNILGLLQQWTDEQVEDRQQKIATAAAYAGYARILLGEAFCSAAIDLGPEMTSAEIFASAEEKFDLAITAAEAAGDDDLRFFALAGRARARLDQGDLTGAAADAALVPADFVWNATASEDNSRRYNRVYAQNGEGQSVSISELYTDAYAATGDPRIAVVDAEETASDNRTPLFFQQKFTTLDAEMPIASGDEAQLILAEAALEGGQRTTAENIFNALRAQAGADPLSAADLALSDEALLVQERSRELFLEGQHLFDVRRFDLPLFPAPGEPYSSVYNKGGDYGDQRCMPLPDVERFNNPNIGG